MIEISLVKKEEITILNKMLQLYLHDISSYFQMEFNSEIGEYEYDSLNKYFTNNDNYAYFIKSDNQIVGFSLVDADDSEISIQEMFIMNGYKSKGIGKEAVFSIFNKHKGNWTVKSLPNSPKAEIFWNRTIKEYTKNNYDTEHVGKYNRAIFTFSNINIDE